MTALIQQIAVPSDTVADTAVVHSPLPGGVAAVVRYFFNLPAWFEAAGAIVGVLIALAIVVLLWRRRARITAWIRGRSPIWKVSAAAFSLMAVGLIAFVGKVSWHYMMHENDFCVSCHVMTPAFQRFR